MSINVNFGGGFGKMPMSETNKAQMAAFQLSQAHLPQIAQLYAGALSWISQVGSNKWRTGAAYNEHTFGKGKGDGREYG